MTPDSETTVDGAQAPVQRLSLQMPPPLPATLQALDPGIWEGEVREALTQLRNRGSSSTLTIQAQKAQLLIHRVLAEIPVGAALVWEDFASAYDRWKSSAPDPKRGVRALPEYQTQARVDKLGGTIILVADCFIAGYFVQESFVDGNNILARVLIFLLAVLLSVGIALATEALAGKSILQPENQPEVGKTRGGRIARILGTLAGLGIAGFIVARQVATLPANFAEILADYSIAWLSIWLPPLSGVLWALGRHLGWSAAHEQRARRWQELARNVEALERETKAVLGFGNID